MTSLEDAGLGALYDTEAEELVVFECVSVDCPWVTTADDAELVRISQRPVHEQERETGVCTAALMQLVSGAVHEQTRMLILQPSMATEDLCDVEPFFVVRRY